MKGILVAAALFGLLVTLSIDAAQHARAQADVAAHARLPHDHVRLDLRLASIDTSVPFKTLTGRIWNHDPTATLTALELRLQLLEGAVVVGERVQHLDIRIPPGQARDVQQGILFRDLGTTRMPRTWTFDVVATMGDLE